MRSLVLPLAAAALLAGGPSSSAGAFAPPAPSIVASPAAATTTTTTTSSAARRAEVGAPPLLSRPARRGIFGIPRPLSRRRDRVATLHMGWGPDPVWSEATVTSNVDACPSGSCVSLSVSVTADEAAGFEVPGQYVQVRPAGDGGAEPIFLAIASPPAPPPAPSSGEGADEAAGPEPAATADDDAADDDAAFEFLVKRTDSNDWIASAASGSKIDVSQVMGGGFPMAENLEGYKYDFPTQNVLLFATGSGIAPIRSAIESGRLGVAEPGRGGRTARLYYGVRTPEDMPYADRFGTWEAGGVEVVPVVSQPEASSSSSSSSGGKGEWDGRTGYVQNALEEDGVPIPRNSGALMCGVKGMTEAVRDILTKAGVFEGRVLTNF